MSTWNYVIVTDRVGGVHEFETLSTSGEWAQAAKRRGITARAQGFKIHGHRL